MKFSLIGKALFLGLAVATGAATGCSSGSAPLGTPSGGGDTSSIGSELRLGRTTHVNKVNYTLTGPNGFSQSGSIDVSKLREVEGVIPNVPAGSPYTLSLNATSTNGNVTCNGSGSITVTCPGTTEAEEHHVKMTCTRGRVGHEWGDDDWRENARTFFVGTEIKTACSQPDGGVDSGTPDTGTPDTGTADTGSPDTGKADTGTPDTGTADTGTQDTGKADTGTPDTGTPDTGIPDTGTPDTCAPTTCAALSKNCGPQPDGCGGTLQCGTCMGNQTCGGGNPGTPGVCGCTKVTACPAGDNCGTVSDNCGGTVTCGTGSCAAPQTCGGGVPGQPNVCGCTPATTCPTPDNCGTIPDGCGTGGTVSCGPACVSPNTCGATAPNVCGCLKATSCPSGEICGTASDHCGGMINCGPACPAGTACNQTQTACTSVCPVVCPSGANCGTFNPGITGCPTLNCGTCPADAGPQEQCVTGANTFGTCQCIPLTACTGGQNCGTQSDGCGGTLNCGSCTGPQTCGGGNPGAPGVCGCTKASCPAGDNCGTIPDGCGTGGTVTCLPNSCPAGQTCGGGPSGGQKPNVCGCTPQTTCPAGQTCGTAPDGCGGMIPCGSCNTPPNTTCGGSPLHCTCSPSVTTCPAGVCGSVPDGCGGQVQCAPCAMGTSCSVAGGGTSGTCVNSNNGPCDPRNPAATTQTCLTSVSAACFACAQTNGCLDQATSGGSCEQGVLLTQSATLFSGPLPDATTCAADTAPAPTPVTERSICLEVMSTVFASNCGASTQLTPCLCGATDASKCLAGTATPTGAAYDLYACDFNSTSGSTINAIESNFQVPTFGAGAANTALACAGAFGCHCLGD